MITVNIIKKVIKVQYEKSRTKNGDLKKTSTSWKILQTSESLTEIITEKKKKTENLAWNSARFKFLKEKRILDSFKSSKATTDWVTPEMLILPAPIPDKEEKINLNF